MKLNIPKEIVGFLYLFNKYILKFTLSVPRRQNFLYEKEGSIFSIVILFFSSCYKDDIDLLKKQIVILQTKIDSLSNALSVNTYQIQKRADSLSSALNVTNSKLNQTNLSIANATKSNIKSTGLHEHIFQRT